MQTDVASSEAEARAWIEALLEMTLPADSSLMDALKTGVVLHLWQAHRLPWAFRMNLSFWLCTSSMCCRRRLPQGGVCIHVSCSRLALPLPQVVLCKVANAVQTGICPTPSESKMPFKQMENIGAYLKACEQLSIPAYDTFQTVDLFEAKNPKAVFTNLHSLGRVAQLLPGYSGPVLGAKLATATARLFTEAQLNEAKATPKFFTAGKQDAGYIPDSAKMVASHVAASAFMLTCPRARVPP